MMSQSLSEDPSNPTSFIEVVVVQVDDHLFAIDVDAALEIRGREPLLPAEDAISSRRMVEIRGQHVPVLDLREHFGAGGYGDHCPAILLLALAGKVFGIAVDDVPIIHSVPYNHVARFDGPAEMPPFCTLSVELTPDRRVPLLDPQELLRAAYADGS